jgi:uncharacterized lipoprotein YmbA
MTGRLFWPIFMSMLVCLVVGSGCKSRQTYDKKHYVLNAVRRGEPIRAETDSTLGVRRFTIDASYADRGLVYRTGEFEYQSDFYNEFLTSPAAMITDKARNWLAESELFRTVLDAASLAEPTHLMEGNITALYGDFRDETSPEAVMEMRVFLLKTEGARAILPVFGRTYRSTADIESENPQDLVKALNACLEDILSSLEKDLAEQVG